ncbi:hypothetical protein MNV_1860012 [Candidatus Methanoperedens nitroreducens]|uniref:Uncharacterized protein n=1 Tax=Candidatus Methanoperedens nitratireducens TaxID=1392998 RepID=A0A284VMW6_9EURY|nr:hypothetical protein MNV_1860012 [Candidatus Methanoperedens nitroreducens]
MGEIGHSFSVSVSGKVYNMSKPDGLSMENKYGVVYVNN